jgi:hypothetical protein
MTDRRLAALRAALAFLQLAPASRRLTFAHIHPTIPAWTAAASC